MDTVTFSVIIGSATLVIFLGLMVVAIICSQIKREMRNCQYRARQCSEAAEKILDLLKDEEDN